MPRQFSLNVKANHSELTAADEAISALLQSAKITTITVNGKEVAASDAPLPDRIKALGAVLKLGNSTEAEANLIALNGQLADQNEKLQTEQGKQSAALASVNQQLSEANANLSIERASVTTLTTKNTELDTLLKAANTENARLTGENQKINRLVSEQGIAFGCLDLVQDGKVLNATHPLDQRLKVADDIPVADKLKAISGALNLAASRIGVNPTDVPGGPSKPAGSQENLLLAKLNATTDPVEKTRLRRENMDKMRAGFRPVSTTTHN